SSAAIPAAFRAARTAACRRARTATARRFPDRLSSICAENLVWRPCPAQASWAASSLFHLPVLHDVGRQRPRTAARRALYLPECSLAICRAAARTALRQRCPLRDRPRRVSPEARPPPGATGEM